MGLARRNARIFVRANESPVAVPTLPNPVLENQRSFTIGADTVMVGHSLPVNEQVVMDAGFFAFGKQASLSAIKFRERDF